VYFVSASQTVGTIDPVSHYAKVCHDVSCSTYGNINFLPSSTSTAIVITDTSITGYAWGDEIGWINMAPTGAGVTVDPATGIMYGTAFSSIGGWVNFRPTNGGVTINASGEFAGYAWVGGLYGGWIKFDCSSPGTCVKTDWRPQSIRPVIPVNTGSILPFVGPVYSTANPSSPEATKGTATQGTTRPIQNVPPVRNINSVSRIPNPTRPSLPATEGEQNIDTQTVPPPFSDVNSPINQNIITATNQNNTDTEEPIIISYPFISEKYQILMPLGPTLKVDLTSLVLTISSVFLLYRFVLIVIREVKWFRSVMGK
jgi:hypothetical protein